MSPFYRQLYFILAQWVKNLGTDMMEHYPSFPGILWIVSVCEQTWRHKPCPTPLPHPHCTPLQQFNLPEPTDFPYQSLAMRQYASNKGALLGKVEEAVGLLLFLKNRPYPECTILLKRKMWEITGTESAVLSHIEVHAHMCSCVLVDLTVVS